MNHFSYDSTLAFIKILWTGKHFFTKYCFHNDFQRHRRSLLTKALFLIPKKNKNKNEWKRFEILCEKQTQIIKMIDFGKDRSDAGAIIDWARVCEYCGLCEDLFIVLRKERQVKYKYTIPSIDNRVDIKNRNILQYHYQKIHSDHKNNFWTIFILVDQNGSPYFCYFFE